MTIKTYAIIIYDEQSQTFADVPVESVYSFTAALLKAEQSYKFWKLCELARDGSLTHFNRVHPVADRLPDIT